MHSSRMLWRDACALSKAVHEKAVELFPRHLDVNELDAVQLVHRFHARLAKPAVMAASSQSPRTPPKKTPGRISVMNGDKPDPSQGMLLGRTQSPSFFSRKPPRAWLSEQGLLDQVAVYGSVGSGRQAAVMTMAMNFATISPPPTAQHYAPAPQHRQALQRSVVMMNSLGDTSVYARATGCLLARKVDPGALRVINLIPGGADSPTHPKRSHAIDLFDGLDEHVVEKWMRAVLADPDALTAQARERVDFVVSAVVRLVVSWCNQTLERLLPSYLGRATTREGLKAHASRQGNVGHLAQQLYALAWGEQAEPLIAQTLTEIHDYLKPLWTDYAHVFNSGEPEIGLKSVFRTPCFVLVLAPDMKRSPASFRLLTRSITVSLQLAIGQQPADEQAKLLVALDGFQHCLTPADISAWRGVGQNATAVLWSEYSPVPIPPWGGAKQDTTPVYWPHNAGAPATHLLMRQDFNRQSIHHSRYTKEILNAQAPKDLTRVPSLNSTLFEKLEPGVAMAVAEDETVKITLAYLDPERSDQLSLARVPTLEKQGYSLSGGEVVLASVSHQARVLQQRLAQLAQTQPESRPTLAWAQETVARMLGFSNWHEAGQRLGKTPMKKPKT